ncbi:guanine nucleotide-binding protein G(q) subunit alpha-like isoform X1 [Penaeus vannamei]|uniref:guanine nucleotide-binding protein G(q) subunit alpha-like isoform X1 n=1 Tax=Penaeus vannamei TaxID=6689 RepID=UPI00387F6786
MPQREDEAGQPSARSIWVRLRNAIVHVLRCLFAFFFSSSHLRNRSPAREVVTEKQEARLLVLGASDTGKSTFMRQMQLLCGHGYPAPERLRHQPHIRRNLLESLHKLVSHLATYGAQPATPEAREAAQAFLAWENLEGLLNLGALMDKTLIPKAQALWADPGIQEVYRRRSDFHLVTNADYFIACAERILQDEYLPTVEDILRMRYVTRGVVEHRHELKDIIITMYDMGGQRPERENWARQILDPSAILFLASLSEFDQNVEEATEEEARNRMVESMEIFGEVLKYPAFQNIPVILILNKNDVFRAKIKEVAIRQFFQDFVGPDYDERAGREYITNRYEQITRDHRRNIMVRYTEATDTGDFQDVFSFVSDFVSRFLLRRGALF